ncbi:MAG: alpha/beta fold hydrolase [Proteobacteria bacterium]|nr:alpha/beta fold hydrolase [Pseudomonadota bacterium]
MPKVASNGVEIEYERFGPVDDTPILLIMGLGAQLTRWRPEFIERLTRRGRGVIRFDNRDVGLSTHLDSAPVPPVEEVIAAKLGGRPTPAPYDLSDMARDALGLMDALQIERAHLVGASMGGMIAQETAFLAPERVETLTSIMSTTGGWDLPPPTPEAIAVMTGPAPKPSDRTAFAEHGVRVWRTIGSPGFPPDDDETRARVLADADRAYDRAGYGRQMAAIYASGDRRERVRRITAPTLVIHGDRDPLVPVEGGRDTAACVPGAQLMIIEGMGHDLPAALYDRIAEAILANVARAG